MTLTLENLAQLLVLLGTALGASAYVYSLISKERAAGAREHEILHKRIHDVERATSAARLEAAQSYVTVHHLGELDKRLGDELHRMNDRLDQIWRAVGNSSAH